MKVYGELSIAEVDPLPMASPCGTNVPGGVATTLRILCPDQSLLAVNVVVRDIRFTPLVQRLLLGPLCRSEAAGLVHLSSSRFSHEFRRIFGMPFRTAR